MCCADPLKPPRIPDIHPVLTRCHTAHFGSGPRAESKFGGNEPNFVISRHCSIQRAKSHEFPSKGDLDLTTTLIVLAHPERRSFNGDWANATARAVETLGGSVLWSDLCAMNFNPVEAPEHYPNLTKEDRFDPLKSQEEAAKTSSLPDDVIREIEKIRKADRVIFHFPLWWFAPPAILKGWFERVFAHGELHSVEKRFDGGQCLGKKALFCVTTGSNAEESTFNGKEGDVEMLLWPTAYTLRYLGFTVLKPEIVHGVHGYHKGPACIDLEKRLQTVLKDQDDLIGSFDERPKVNFNNDSDFDAHGRLLPEFPSHSHFIRHFK